ncbi:MAG TPA: polysaccharide deacetylase family protein [bacterium]|nr:polysaccharide deacetylase family protein [bacterium]
MKRFFLIVTLLLFTAVAGVVLVSFSNSLVPILMYHSVGADSRLQTPVVSPAVFAKQIEFLQKNGFFVISLEEYVRSAGKATQLPYKCVVITFDDGYEDNYANAYPLLKAAGFPATVFIPSDYLGTPGYISSDQAKEMCANSIMIGSHSVSHAFLPSLVADAYFREVRESKDLLEKRLGSPVNLLCYPLGGYSAETAEAARKAGYIGACTTNRSASVLNTDLFALNRIKLTERDQYDLLLWAKTSRIYNLFRGIRNFYRNREGRACKQYCM